MSRLAYLCTDPGIPVFGTKGASVHVQEVVRSFRALGWDVTVYCTRRGDVVPSDLADLRVVEQRVAKGSTVERERRVASAAAVLADIAVQDGFDLVYERYSLFGTGGARAAAAASRPLVVEVNAPLVDEQGRHRELVDAAGAWSATRRTFVAADQLVCVSEPVASWVRALVDDDRTVRVVPNGVNTRRITPPATEPEPFTVGFVGTLKPWHGVEVLVEAFARAARPDWSLLLCGDGPGRGELEALARRRGVDVTFTGAVAPADVPRHLARMSVATAPYPAADGDDHYFSPLKLYEYFAAGLPVVASRIGQTAVVVRDGENGLLVPAGDPDALAAALTRLSESSGLRSRLGGTARSDAVRDHDWLGVVGGVLAHAGVAA
ncbi:glycosyltransferase family 4 protein [Aeromicrobium halocynthiae]|uniref:Glycosyltransferase family 4 protein n=1 Tax=Aeromicrobium halocynthiae TaxID=560557 RepID=A0ABN2VQF9_9ACTN